MLTNEPYCKVLPKKLSLFQKQKKKKKKLCPMLGLICTL